MNGEKIPMIYSAICGVMEDVGAVGKGDYNKTQGFRYRGIDAVMNALNPAMIKHKIFCTPEVLEQSREERTTTKGSSLIYSVCRMRYRFFTTDGSFVDAVVVGEGMDSGDKATNKAMAVAFKYACFQTFCIPTENLMDDPDRETPEESIKRKSSEEKNKDNNESDGKGNRKRLEGEKKENNVPSDEKGKNNKPDSKREELMKELAYELSRTGYSGKSILKTYKVDNLDNLSSLQIKDAIGRLKKCLDKAAS